MHSNHLTHRLLNNANFTESSSPVPYRFEQGGMLVYDVKAALFRTSDYSSPVPFTPLHPCSTAPDSNASPIQQILTEDFEIYEKVKKLSPQPQFPVFYNLYIPDDSITLVFNSKFESGNLVRAIKLSDYEYSLTIRSDMYSNGNNHWYYFSVQNPRKTPVTFHITNMKKNDGLYKLGMKPAVYSSKTFENLAQGWHRDGYNVAYKSRTQPALFYTLSFTYSFKYENDLVYFAYSYPYTYPQLQSYLKDVQEKFSHIARVDRLCESLARNVCDILTITNKVGSYNEHNEEISESKLSCTGRKIKRIKKNRLNPKRVLDHKHKKGVFLTARVHSGETVSSYAVQGAIDFLLGNSKKAKILRDNFVFKIVPMLNPDGVRYGNYRCSLLGVDLNRRWDFPNKDLHPTIFYTKKMLQAFNERHPVALFCDFHGHTKKQNVFMYGCVEDSTDLMAKRRNLCVKVVPVLMQSNKFFSFKDCHFRVDPSRVSTARVVVFKELNILNSYTIESSFFGSRAENGHENKHMTPTEYASVGETLCELLSIFLNDSLFHKKLRFVSEFISKPCFPAQNSDFLKDLQESNADSEVQTVGALISNTQWEDIALPDVEESDGSEGSESNPDERPLMIDKRSKSTPKAKVPPQNIYKPVERPVLYTKNELKPISNKRFQSVNAKLTLIKRTEESKINYSFDKSPQKPKALSPYRIANRINILLEHPLAQESEYKKIELPKIEKKFSSKLSPRNYNFINYSWIEEYAHTIASSMSSNHPKNFNARYT